MSTFPFDKHQGRDVVVAVIVYGGPTITFDALSVFQQNLFMNQLFEANIRDFENFITQHNDPRDWYTHFVQYTSIAVPVYIVMVYDEKVLLSIPITNIQDMADKFSDVSSKANGTGRKQPLVYSKEDSKRFNRFILNNCIKGSIISSNDIAVRAFSDMVDPSLTFDTLDEHLCYLGMKTGEFINSPHYLYVNAPDRLKDAAEEKALSFWKLTQIS